MYIWVYINLIENTESSVPHHRYIGIYYTLDSEKNDFCTFIMLFVNLLGQIVEKQSLHNVLYFLA